MTPFCIGLMECFEDNVKGGVCPWADIVTDDLFGFSIQDICYPDVFGLSSYKALYFIYFIGALSNDCRTRDCMNNLYNSAK